MACKILAGFVLQNTVNTNPSVQPHAYAVRDKFPQFYGLYLFVGEPKNSAGLHSLAISIFDRLLVANWSAACLQRYIADI